jgi:hypothetical protein
MAPEQLGQIRIPVGEGARPGCERGMRKGAGRLDDC